MWHATCDTAMTTRSCTYPKQAPARPPCIAYRRSTDSKHAVQTHCAIADRSSMPHERARCIVWIPGGTGGGATGRCPSRPPSAAFCPRTHGGPGTRGGLTMPEPGPPPPALPGRVRTCCSGGGPVTGRAEDGRPGMPGTDPAPCICATGGAPPFWPGLKVDPALASDMGCGV